MSHAQRGSSHAAPTGSERRRPELKRRGSLKPRPASHELDEKGFVLIASLLLLLVLSTVAVGLILVVNTEKKTGANDLQNNLAYHNAEGAIEKMTSDMATMLTSIQSPTPANITSLSSLAPTNDPLVSYAESFTPTLNADGSLYSTFKQISSGPNQGLYAQVIPVQLSVTAQRTFTPLGNSAPEVTMVRNVEIALIPVFQFGVFSDSDLGFFNSPTLNFAGRVHTNGDLYLGVSSGNTLSFQDKLTAYGNVIREVMPNGLSANTYGDTGNVYIQSTSGGCSSMPGGSPGSNCIAIGQNQGSVVSGPTSAQNSTWPVTSQSTYNGWIVDGNYGNPGGTGALNLSLPFTANGYQSYEIIRKPPAGESTSSTVSQSRLINQSQIRVLLVDDPSELPGGASDGNNIRLANVQTNTSAPNYTNGVPASTPSGLPALVPIGSYTTYFAEATDSTNVKDTTGWVNGSTSALPADWPNKPAAPPAGHATLTPTSPVAAPFISTAGPNTWNLLDGYLRVEYTDASGVTHPVTKEWLQLGFARGLNPPGPSPNPVNPNAILIFQQPADRNGNGTLDAAATCTGRSCVNRPAETPNDTTTLSPYYGDSSVAGSASRNNWYPINFYDSREGEPRDAATGDGSCTANGVMNAVELDVGNLKKWLAGTIGSSGASVDWVKENGYILYFSDRRGMAPNPNSVPANAKTGDSGLEDVINTASTAGTPDEALEPIPTGKTVSPEDVNANGKLDNFGAWNMGAGFNVNTGTTAATLNPYGTARIANCFSTARKNAVSGARHVLKLVDGALGNLPTQPSGNGGFTVASENPVYILGNYNTSSTDPIWQTPAGASVAHAAAGIIADSVSLLSNSWQDAGTTPASFSNGIPSIVPGSLLYPTGATQRPAATTYYRVAIAAGKNMTFPATSYTQTGTLYGFGTDGGVHNFLRFLEDWTGQTLNYEGSLVSLYYSTYNTGVFKCCGDAVYHPPARNYIFDPLFTQPQNLPPGTPMFRDVDNLSYNQNFTPR